MVGKEEQGEEAKDEPRKTSPERRAPKGAFFMRGMPRGAQTPQAAKPRAANAAAGRGLQEHNARQRTERLIFGKRFEGSAAKGCPLVLRPKNQGPKEAAAFLGKAKGGGGEQGKKREEGASKERKGSKERKERRLPK
jgi:hypothetical protein